MRVSSPWNIIIHAENKIKYNTIHVTGNVLFRADNDFGHEYRVISLWYVNYGSNRYHNMNENADFDDTS